MWTSMTTQRSEALLPDLYVAADSAAQAVQRSHLRVVKSELWLLIGSAVLALIASAGVLPLRASLLAALALVVSIMVSFVGRAKKFERQWFDCRAIAESAKTMAWRYMARAEPYGGDRVESEIEALFAKELTGISRARPDVAGMVARYTAGAAQITKEMRRMRGMPLDGRRSTYLEKRLCYERDWYRGKAAWNSNRDAAWFALTIALQLVAVATAVVFAPCHNSTSHLCLS
jgi:hypothetical protein